MSWNEFEKYLIETRYAIRKDGEPIEHSYRDITDRIWNYLLQGDVINNMPLELIPYIDKQLKFIEDAISSNRIVPASPVLMHFGTPSKHKTYFSCFPLGYVGDSIEEIMSTSNDMALIYRAGGGCGIDISKLRPCGLAVSNGQGVSSGPKAFLHIYNGVTEAISEGGKRKGALMVSIDANHIDIPEILDLKKSDRLTNMNISVVVPDIHKFTQIDQIAKYIHACGDPGIIFLDNAYENTPIPLDLEPRHVNPCAEYMSVAETACNLVHVNLPEIANEVDGIYIDFLDLVEDAAFNACLFANILISQDEGYPLDNIRQMTQAYRPVGIGMLGLHHALIRLDLDYDAHYAKEIQQRILIGSMHASANLQNLFELNETSVPCTPNLMFHPLSDITETETIKCIRNVLDRHYCLYNMVTTSQAPTGSVAQLVHSYSTGIEPIYAREETRKIVTPDGFKTFTLHKDLDRLYETAHEIDPTHHLMVAAAVQKYCHTGVSKTVNLPENITVDEIKSLIILAHQYKLKSVTFYRDHSKDVQILEKTSEPNVVIDPASLFPSERNGTVYTIRGPMTCIVTVTKVEGVIREVFVTTGKGGTALNAMCEALGRVISTALRANPDLRARMIKTLRGIDSGYTYVYEKIRYKSIPDVIAALLCDSSPEPVIEIPTEDVTGDLCPSCGYLTFVREGNCATCHSCGHSTC